MLICCNMHLDLQSITAATPFRHLNSISLTKLVYHHYQPVAFLRGGWGMRGARYFFPALCHIACTSFLAILYTIHMKTMRRVWRVGCKGGVQEKNLTREVRTPLKIPEHAPVINTHTKCSLYP